MRPPPFKVARVFALYDAALGESGGQRSVVDATDYLEAVQLLIRYRLDVKRLMKRHRGSGKPPPYPATVPSTPDEERLGKAEAQLWMWSSGLASHFEDYPAARPLDSLRETR